MATTNPKPHAVMLPYPATGHVNPLLQFSKLLHSRGFHITFVFTEHHRRRLVRAKGPDSVRGLPDFRFETIPDGLPPNDVKQPAELVCDLMRRNGLASFRALLQRLNSASDTTPRVTCIVSDGIMTFAMQAARELGVPEAQFWTASAIGLVGYCQFAELVTRGILPLKDESYKNNGYLETLLEWVPGIQGMRLKHIPSFPLTTDPQDMMLNYMIEQTLNMSQSSGVIVNTFEELEGDVLRALAPIYPRIFPVGPLFRLLSLEDVQKSMNQVQPSLWRENDECSDWLDGREAGSVVYVNFGSVSMINEGDVEELAWGLAGSGYDFLWVLRRDIMKGEPPILPGGFGGEVRGRGMIVSWCHQDKVISHPAVGLFITHAGWNSLLESVCTGVHTLCWPFYAEQSINALQVCTLWGNGLEIKQGSKRSEIASLINEMMSGKRGIETRERATEWKEKAEAATSPGGSSFVVWINSSRKFSRKRREVS